MDNVGRLRTARRQMTEFDPQQPFVVPCSSGVPLGSLALKPYALAEDACARHVMPQFGDSGSRARRKIRWPPPSPDRLPR